MRALLRGLKRLDAVLAAAETALLCLLLLGLAASVLALVLLQNASGGGAVPAAWALGLGAAGTVAAFLLGWRRGGGGPHRGFAGRLLLFSVWALLLGACLRLGPAVDYLSRVSVLWIGILGAGLATRERRHITIEALERFLPPARRRWILAFLWAVAALLLLILAAVAWRYTLDTRERGTVLFELENGFRFPGWWARLILPAGFLLMAWRSLLIVLEEALGEAPERPGAEPPPGELRP